MLSSMGWVLASSAGGQVVGFVIFVVVARLVTPAEFGVFTLAVVLIDLLQIVAGAGLAEAVIQRRTLSDRAADTAFWSQLAIGAGFALDTAALAGPVAALFGMPDLARAIRVLAATLVIAPLGAIHAARLTRAFGFRALAVRNLAANLLSGCLGVWLALAGGGVDALLAQRLTAALAIAAIGCLSYPWLPRLRFDAAEFRALAGYGLQTMGAQLLLQATSRSAELVAGFMLGPVAVATLRVANRCVDLLTQLAVVPFQQLALPLLARAQDDRALGRATYAKLSRLSALVIYPAFAGACVLAPTVLPLVFGEPWREAGRTMQLICLVAVALHFNVLLPAALGAAGHPGQALAWSAVQLLVGVPAVAAGAAYGILGLVAANIARAYLLLPLGFGLLWRSTGIGIGAVAGGVLRPLAAAVLMAGLVAAILAALTPVLPPWAVLFCGVATGAVSYAALVLLLMQRELREHRGALPSWLQRRLGARFDHSR